MANRKIQVSKQGFLVILSTSAVMLMVLASAFRQSSPTAIGFPIHNALWQDSAKSVQAFQQVYKVLMSPRCMNCHPAGDVPLQGEDSHLHESMPKRGKDGTGLYVLKCSNCHQPANTPGIHMPPGNPKWKMPPEDMKMIFQGKTAHELALQIMDASLNGHKDKQQLLDHVNDTLVAGAWNPGEGRSLPPMSYAEFRKAWNDWIVNGGFAPKE